MSWRHIEAAGPIEVSPPAAKAVLLVLAHHANAHTCRCWPSLERIMLFSGLKRRAVQMALRTLENEELIVTDQGTGRIVSSYLLTLPDVDPIEQGGRNREAQDMRPSRADNSARGAGRAPVIVKEPQENDARLPRQGEQLPDGWWPDPDSWDWALKTFTMIDHNHETHLFIDVSKKKGELYVDPIAAWKAWLRRGEGFAKRDASKPANPTRRGAAGSGGADRLRKAAASARRQDPQG